MIKFNLSKKDIVYFGDSMADFDVAKRIGINFVGIGYNIYDILLNSSENTCYLANFRDISLI